MQILVKHFFLLAIISLSTSILFASNNPFSDTFLDIDHSENTFLSNLQLEAAQKKEKKRLKVEKLQQIRIQKQKESEAKHAKLRAYIKRRAAEYDTYEKNEAEKRKIALEKEQQERIITAKIDISQQRVAVFRGDDLLYDWKVSTARRGYHTPRGEFQPTYMTQMHYSRKYHNSPMPYSVFFRGGYAMHGTSSVHRLGTPASHGCVRLHTSNAKKFYQLVQEYGKQNTHIVIED